MRDISGKQRRHLRALGNALVPALHIGREGVTEALIRQADVQLEAHELIKVKVSVNAPEDRHDTAGALAERTHAYLAQVLGRTALLYRPRKKKPTIVLPEGEGA